MVKDIFGKINFILPDINLQLKSALRTEYLFYQTLLYFKSFVCHFTELPYNEFCTALSTIFIFLVSTLCHILKLQLLVIMLHPSSPKHNDKPDTEEWIDKFGKLFQSLDSIFVFLLQSFIFVKFLKCLFLPFLINIDKFSPSEKQLVD